MKNRIILLLLTSATLYFGCKKEGFPVPPASTVAAFTFSVDNNGFAPATVVFTNTSIIPERAGTVNYTWNFGDGISSNEASPSHVFGAPGVFEVSLVVVANGSGEIKKHPKPSISKTRRPRASRFFSRTVRRFSAGCSIRSRRFLRRCRWRACRIVMG